MGDGSLKNLRGWKVKRDTATKQVSTPKELLTGDAWGGSKTKKRKNQFNIVPLGQPAPAGAPSKGEKKSKKR